MDLISKYNLIFDQASSPKSVDCGRIAIYQFEHYCRGCGAGLVLPSKSEGKQVFRLYNRGYCSYDCIGGKRKNIVKVKEDRSFKNNISSTEKLAFISLELGRWVKSLNKIDQLIVFAESRFRLLSEKLSFLEFSTNKSWGSSQYYYRLNKIK